MATPAPFQIDDQTDEDFFDKLVDDDFGSELHPHATDMARFLSDLSIGDDGGATLDDSGDDRIENEVVAAHRSLDTVVDDEVVDKVSEPVAEVPEPEEAPQLELKEVTSSDSSVENSGWSKRTSVKEVQWSSFYAESQPFGMSDGFGSYSDFTSGNIDASDEFKSSFTENTVSVPSMDVVHTEQRQVAHMCSSVAEQTTADLNDPQYWDNLYPGWKYDPSTGQWYQVDSNRVTANFQSDSYNAAGVVAQESSQDKFQVVEDELVKDQVSEISYLQQTAKSVSGTVVEDSTVGVISENTGYPPNMVFDSQYPGWYYDTNSQQWYTLESYTQAVQTTVQDQPTDHTSALHGFSSTLNVNSYNGISQFGQNSVQGNSSMYSEVRQFEQNSMQHRVGQETLGNCDASVNNTAQQNMWKPEPVDKKVASFSGNQQGTSGTWDASATTYAQWNMWQPKQVDKSVTSFSENQQDTLGNWDASASNYAQQNMWKPEQVEKNVASYPENQRETSGNWDVSVTNYTQQNMWKPEPVDKNIASFSTNQQVGSFYGSNGHVASYQDQRAGFESFGSVSTHSYGSTNGVSEFRSYVPAENVSHFSQPKMEHSGQAHLSNNYYGNHNAVNYSPQSFQGSSASYSQPSYSFNKGNSSAGRPPHALVTFGFGGKLIVMKDPTSLRSKLDYGSQDTSQCAISVLNLMEVLMDKTAASSAMDGGCGYIDALCQHSFPGPLVGGNSSTKDVMKWIEERITHCESPTVDPWKGEQLRLLLSILKISCQQYGKLRSPFASDPSLEETDGPESSITKLFASAKRNSAGLRQYSSSTHFMQHVPSESQIQSTAIELQNLLVSGKRKEALQCAQQGQLWGPALVLAAQLGHEFYADTVKQMAHHQFVCGSPLRTLCLLIAGQPGEVFSVDSFTYSNSAGDFNVSQQPAEAPTNAMLDEWEDNMAIITANRTKDDELVIVHLGDCLWKMRGEVTAAHTCYLVAEANFGSYSDTARLCLIGADHWRCPRTYVSPEAIQRTELYEYAKVLGNSQFVLLPFQPYKLIYAHMLAEVGKVSDSLRYCQASLKSLKNSGRAPEVETWKLLLTSLEERLRTHQQGGYSTAKLVGKLFTSIDRSIHRMMGVPPSPLPPLSPSSGNESYYVAPKVVNSQSTMAMSSLIPSPSEEAMSEWTGDNNRKIAHNRSISEPDFGRSPKQDASKDAGSPDSQNKASGSGFGRIGSQLLQKTMGWVSRSRPDRQAKLGEKNKFYFDEKLKRWVEEGAEPPAQEAALPPPPTTASFQNGVQDYNINNAFKSTSPIGNGGPETKYPNPSEHASGIPPIPPTTNQFSARSRMGVRSRYVDTFNKGGGTSTNSFQSPTPVSVKSPVGAKFFIPTIPAASNQQNVDSTEESSRDVGTDREQSTSSMKEASVPSPQSATPSASSMHRFPSMENITSGNEVIGPASGSGISSLSSRGRAASWSGASDNGILNPSMSEMNSAGDGHGVPSPFASRNPSPIHHSSPSFHLNGSSPGDELHEVQL